MRTAPDTIRFRLSAAQMSVIWPGLDLIVKGYISHREKKTSPYRYPFWIAQPGLDRGVFQPKVMDQIRALWKALQTKAISGGRVQMHAIQVRAAILSVRVNLDMRRKQKHDGRRWNSETKERLGIDEHSLKELRTKSQRMISTLERHMKRANRALRASVTHSEYEASLKDWRMHLRWMRLHLVYFKPLPPVVNGRKKRQQLVLDILMTMTADGLRSAGYEAPDPKDLRKLMRLYARSARRCREGIWTLEYLMKYPTFFDAKYHLANFVMQRRELKELPEQ